ncbi:hypothetical protein Tco_1384595 [Tanacetum coccineum]
MPSFDATDSFVAAAHGVWRRCWLPMLREHEMPERVFLLGLWTQIGWLMLLRCRRFFRCRYPWRAPMVAGDDADFLLLCFVSHSLQTPVFWRGQVNLLSIAMTIAMLNEGTERRRSASWRGNLLKLQPWQICPVSPMLYPSEPINNNSGQFLEPLGRY